MDNAQWNWYAAQELFETLARVGLRCPNCEQQTKQMDRTDQNRFCCRLCLFEFSPADYRAAGRRSSKSGQSTLFRPIGDKELDKIKKSNYTKFPSRVQWQPIFYPVLTRAYADAIARDWNSRDASHHYVGYVTRFNVRNEYLHNFEIQTVADRETLEYWIPADDLEAFNENIVGVIQVVAMFRYGKLVELPSHLAGD